ncbi:NYN domain-containing protein [Candidatus Shapirobacteria bacterium]|nr:NYN domain-containing protein [Candidatus Shapirobacteria bacterium]
MIKAHIKGKAIAFIDYANVKSWLSRLAVTLDLKKLFELLKQQGVERICFYYGTDPQNPSSFAFFQKIRSFGYDITTKSVKYHKISLRQLLQKPINRRMLKSLDPKIRKVLLEEIEKLDRKGISLLSPKCNMDVEISLDMFLGLEDYQTFVLFSGDGDFEAALKFLRSEGKKVIVIAKRQFLAGSLIKNCDVFLNFDKLIRSEGLTKKTRTSKIEALE